ncbi:hypothetical protein MMC17_004728 [Xylographa soralifera]|nr:hypothetical protein [Xylographa soralifera]
MPSSLYDSYQHLITHIVPGPNSISYFIPLLLLPVALLIPPSVFSKSQLSLLFLPPIHACFLHSCLFGGGLDVISSDAVIWCTVLIGLQDVRGTYKRIRTVENPELPPGTTTPSTRDNKASERFSNKLFIWEEPYPSTLSARIRWVLDLLPSIRLSGWKIGDLVHDSTQPPTPLTRRAYLRHAALIASTSFLLFDTATFLARHDSYFTDRSVPISSPYPSALSTSVNHSALPRVLSPLLILPPYILRPLVIATHIYATMTLGGALATTPLLVLPTPFSPHLYPMFFGPFSSVLDRGLRGLWGTWWHQTMRYQNSMPGRALAQYLGLQPGGRGDYALRTISAFGLSGWIHMGLVPPEPLGGVDAWKVRMAVGVFFWVQVLGFAVEVGARDLARWMGLGKRGRERRWSKIGRRAGTLVWVLGWLCGTLPLLGWAGKELGYFGMYPLPVSLWMRVVEGKWWTWGG